MNRKNALDKLCKVCQRLDAVNPDEFFVIPLRLYLFGSLLTDKPNPKDVDLLFQFDFRPDQDPSEFYYALCYGKPPPHQKAISYLRKGMQMIRFEFLSADSQAVVWLQDRAFGLDTPVKLMWESGFDWKRVVSEVETQPAEWQPAVEQLNKYIQVGAKRIKEEKGERGAVEWIHATVNLIKEEKGEQAVVKWAPSVLETLGQATRATPPTLWSAGDAPADRRLALD